jgi:hypothetical protein
MGLGAIRRAPAEGYAFEDWVLADLSCHRRHLARVVLVETRAANLQSRDHQKEDQR